MFEPLVRGVRCSEVRLVGQLWFVKPEQAGGRAGLDRGRQIFDVYVVPLHWDERKGAGVAASSVGGRPVIKPGDFAERLGEEMDRVGVVGRPRKAAFGLWRGWRHSGLSE